MRDRRINLGYSQIPTLSYAETSLQLHINAARENLPLNGGIDITNRCNLRCVHCYIRDTYCSEELSYQELCSIMDQVADAGCLWFTITGGEPLIRPDFRDIYTYAKKKGFFINLFSNGTLLTPSLIDFLAEQPPFVIEITLYGMTSETYERVTDVPGSFNRCINGIELALKRNLPVKLKTMLLTINSHELQDMKQYAKKLGVSFVYDPLINNKIDGSQEPKQYRLTPEEIVSAELQDPELSVKLLKEFNRLYGIKGLRDNIYTCGAGKGHFHITSDGKLNVCTMSRVPSYDLRIGNLKDGLSTFPKILERKRTRESECRLCSALSICGQCPAWAELEHSDPEEKVDFLCQTAKLRVDAFVNKNIRK
ncbi:radical SAM protein [Chloroflexota bacterium]